jgi:hypothetical protein
MVFGTSSAERMRINSTGLAVTGNINVTGTTAAGRIGSTIYAGPVASGSGTGYAFRIDPIPAGHGEGLDFGNAGGYSWIQSRDIANYATNFELKLNPNGGVVSFGGGILTTAITMGSGTGTVSATAGVFSVTSDLRAKNQIGKFTKGLAEIVALADHSEIYSFKSDEKNTPRAGWYAQDVEPLIPEAVFHDGADGMASLDERPIVVALVNAVKELSARLAALESK